MKDSNKTLPSHSSGRQLEQGLNYLTKDGVAAQCMVVLTSGAFLIAFAIELGASNFQIGLLAAIGPLAQLLQIPGIYIVETVRNRKKISLVMVWLNRICWIAVAFVPFFYSGETALTAFLLLMILSSSATAISTCSWNSWIRDLVPDKIMGEYFARRMRLGIGAGIFLSLAAAVFLDLSKNWFGQSPVYSYSILFLAGAGAGITAVLYLGRVPNVPMADANGRISLLHSILEPLKDANFRKLIGFLCSWSFAANLAAPFFMVYMLRRLGLSMSMVVGLSLLGQLSNYTFLMIWGRFIDRFSNKSVLSVCGPLMIGSFLGWTFTTMPGPHFLTIPLLAFLHIIVGVAASGMVLGSSNIAFKMAPRGKATSYLAANTIFVSIAAGTGPMLGGKFADFFYERELSWTLEYTTPYETFTLPTLNLQQWDFFFVLAFIIGLYSLHRLRKVTEVGEVGRKIVAGHLMIELRRQIRILSSVEGLRQMVTFPFGLIRELKKEHKIEMAEEGNDGSGSNEQTSGTD